MKRAVLLTANQLRKTEKQNKYSEKETPAFYKFWELFKISITAKFP